MSEASSITVVVGEQGCSLRAISNVVRKAPAEVVVVLSPSGLEHIPESEKKAWLKELRALNADRSLILATKHDATRVYAEGEGWKTLKTIKELRELVKDHDSLTEARRVMSPSAWREDIRSKLQSAGLLALPKLRIWVLLGTSIGVFGFIFFRVLPTAEVKIWPNREAQNYATNVFLVASGSEITIPHHRVKQLTLRPMTIHMERTITYDQISKNFTGKNATTTMTIFNETEEEYSIRKGTRIVNQAGMRFKLLDDAFIPAKGKKDVRTEADALDLYGEVIGERGNVPAGIKWDFPGLTEQERKMVYARNESPAKGGNSAYVNEFKREDMEGAKKKLEQELLAAAKQEVDEQRTLLNEQNGSDFVLLNYDVLTSTAYSGYDLGEPFLGKNVTSVPVRATIDYTVLLFDETDLLNLLKDEIATHVSNEKIIDEDTLSKENMDLHVIPPWDDALHWVKITADLTYTQRYLLNPITPSGAKFGKYIRDNVAGKSVDDAYRIIKNLPEVSKAEISVSPFWATKLPGLGTSIDVTEVVED